MSSAVDAPENASRLAAGSRPIGRSFGRSSSLWISARSPLAFGCGLPPAVRVSDPAGRPRRRRAAQLPMVVGIQLLTLFLFGVYRFIWRYVGMSEIRTFVASACAARSPDPDLAPRPAGVHCSPGACRFRSSSSTPFWLSAECSACGCCAGRSSSSRRNRSARTAPTIPRGSRRSLVGAGRAGVLAAREISSVGDMSLEVKGFVDDDPAKQGSVIQGFPVLGTTEDLPRLVKEMGIEKVVIAIARISRREILRIIDICHKIPVKLRIIPGLYQIIQGKVQVSRIRNVQIEDLLGREPVELDEEQVGHFLAGRTIMVTGAGGSIGSELARQVARFKPDQLAPRRARRVRPLRDRPGAAALVSGAPNPSARRRRRRRAADPLDLRDVSAARRPARGRAQARADDGVEPGRGDQEQHPRRRGTSARSRATTASRRS